MKHLGLYIIFLAFFLSGPAGSLYSQTPATAPSDTTRSLVLERIGGVYRFNFFRKPWVRRWHVAGLRSDLSFRNTPLIGSLNYGTLVGRDGGDDTKANLQVRVEAYPRLTPSDYAYLGAAYSGSSLFPRHYYGAEWFHSFPRGYEASLGVRWMQWQESIWFYTGSAGKYLGNYWFSLRAFITPGEKTTGQTYTLSARRYLATGMDYLGLKLEYGNSPDNLSYLLDFPQIRRLNSMGAHLSWQRDLNRWLLYLDVGYRREEFQDDVFRGHFSARLHLLYQLNK
ncbi:MAG: YaiO family outer membrane beta-barrel protein [Bacteroidales bacterium]|nr:YaiO family outer membrane beta-barrel protein [Bacteroidales bacterium]